jgi:hypothetical protein
MIGSNGRANSSATASPHGPEVGTALGVPRISDHPERFCPEEIRRYTAELESPFDPQVIEWRVTNTSHNKSRGQIIPYADQRAYSDRLNALFTPAGWTRKYTIHTSANFERSKDQKIAAKVLVTCELTIFGLGLHSATGEEWADNDNAGTAAEAQAFKRACSCFGLGRYLYYFEGIWVDLDERKRPRSVPQLPNWATPEGWAQGLRPNVASKSNGTSNRLNARRKKLRAWRNCSGADSTADYCAIWQGFGTHGKCKTFRCSKKCWSTCDPQNVDYDVWKPLSTRQVPKRSLRSSKQSGLVRLNASKILKR